MNIVPIKINQGEEKAWQQLCELPNLELCKRSGALFDDRRGAYILKCFGMDFIVSPCDKIVKAVMDSEKSKLFTEKLNDLFRIAILWYMNSSKDIPLSGRLLRPVDIKGGHRFSAGTHVLPLDSIAERYAANRKAFIDRGREFGAVEISGYGDAYIRLYPLPRVPVDMILWMEDEEFPPKVDLFFDSTCELQLSLSDVVWAVSLICCVVMLE